MSTLELNGYTIEVKQDEYSEGPEFWGNEDVFLVYDHRQFSVERKGFDAQEINDHCADTRRLFYKGYFVFPLYAYIHSGVSLSLGRSYPHNCPWDTSMRGFVLVKRAEFWSKAKARKAADSIVSEWNQYLSGDVWGYVVKDAQDNEVDSCWGFYGFQYCEDEARAVVASLVASAFTKRLQSVKTFIRNRVPLEVRMNTLNG